MKYAIVFDMDETLGFFEQINYLWHSMLKINNNINNNLFKEILNLYPEFIRPNLIQILKYLKEKKEQNRCSNIIIYTNNRTSKEWVTLIQNYFNEIINYDLFDKIICAFKINNKILEINRTSYDKSFDDLIKCSFIDPKSNICFIDDKYYPDMNKNNLIYIQIKKYIYELNKNILFERLYKSTLVRKNIIKKNIIDKLYKNFDYVYKNQNVNIEIHKIISKKLLYHLNKFFYKNFTLKKKLFSNSKTKKNIKCI